MASEGYLAQLQGQRDTAAKRADDLAIGFLRVRRSMSEEDRQTVLESLRAANRESSLLDQQIAWHNRRTGWTSPIEPVWTD